MEALSTHELRRRTREIAEVLRNPDEAVERLYLATAELEQLLYDIHGVESAVRDESARYRLGSRHGEVISPGYAVSTMQDAVRTAKYLRALLAAIGAHHARHQRPAHVLYAGCGPNAPFFVLAALLAGDQATFTLLDILTSNCEAARKVATALGLQDAVKNVVVADAAEYQHSGAPFDIVVLEIMQSGLRGEPQVAVTLNLAPQLAPEGALIPERITLRAVLADPSAELSYRRTATAPEAARALRRDLGEVFVLTRDTREHDIQGQARALSMPNEIGSANQLTILTEISLHDDIRLEECESGLTTPQFLFQLGTAKPRQQIRVHYVLGQWPELRCEPVIERPRVSTP